MAVSSQTSLLLFIVISITLLQAKIPAARILTPVSAPGTASEPAPLITTNREEQQKQFIQTSCSKTRYPNVCYKNLVKYADNVEEDPARLAQYAISVSLKKAQRDARYITSQRKKAKTDQRIDAVLQDCQSTFKEAIDEMRRSLSELHKPKKGAQLRFQLSNVQTWMSAALTNESTCADEFDDGEISGQLKSDMISRVGETEQLTSNALALVNSYAASVTA